MKKLTVIVISFLLIISLSISCTNSISKKLKDSGYNDSEIKTITQNLNESEINYIIEKGYNKYLIDLINKSTDKIEYNDFLIDLVYNSNFNINNLERYLNYYQNNPNISDDAIISIVNNGVDMFVMEYDDLIINLIKTKYFIADNTKRYINYYKQLNNPNLDEVIKAVNCNIDYEFYTNIKAADVSKGNLILVNKYYSLDKNFVPKNLVTIENKYGKPSQLKQDAYEAYKAMWEEASKEGLYLYATSPYRSYNTQTSLYNTYVQEHGKEKADTFSARPGHSEHQTGLAIDIVSKNSNFDNFEETMEFSWLLENAHRFGFILRYPKEKEYITGYMYEPWHYRYIGIEVAKKIKELDLTYEEYYAYFVK